MNTNRRSAHPAVATYVAAVRDELGDLPPDELADIAEDVRDHLDQVAAEFGDDVSIAALIDRLGAPAAYAAELRAAAGIPEPEPAQVLPRIGFVRRLLRFMVAFFGWAALGLAALAVVDILLVLSGGPALFGVPALVCAVLSVAGALLLVIGRDDPVRELRQLPSAGLIAEVEEWMRATPWGQPAIDLVTALRPAWWIARAAALGLVVALVSGSATLGVVTFLGATVVSVWIGRRAAVGEIRGRRLLGVQLANAGLAIAGVLVAANIVDRLPPDYVEYAEAGYSYPGPGFYDQNGEPVTNIFAYGADGALLENVRLYDQNGHPLNLGWFEECFDGAVYPEQSFTVANPWGDHVFPRLTVGVDDLGTCQQPELDPPFGAQLPGTPSPATPVPTAPTADPLK